MILPEFKGGETLIFPTGMARVRRVRRPKALTECDEPIYRLDWRMVLGGRVMWVRSKTEFTLQDLQASRLVGWE